MNKFTFHHGGIAFHWVVLTYIKYVEAVQRASLGTLIEEASVLSSGLSWKLTLVESALDSIWVKKMWLQKLRTGWLSQSKSLNTPSRVGICEN